MKEQGIELLNKRKLREKHFLNKDGTITAYMYNEDIHYTKGNNYEEIDNHLIFKKNKFINNKNDFKVEFESISNEKLITVKNQNKILEFNLKGQESTLSDKAFLHTFGFDSEETSLTDEINYYNIKKNIDLSYELKSNQLKESIILNNPSTIDTDLTFQIKTGNMKLELQDDNSIHIKTSRKHYFTITTPYMFDQNKEASFDIQYNIKKMDDYYELKIIPNKSWLLDESRVYPVVIDPTIETKKENLIDTTIYEDDDNDLTRHEAEIMRVGTKDGKKFRSLIKFNLPEIQTGDNVIDAQLSLYAYPVHFYESKEINPIAIHRINKSWTQENANWKLMHNAYDSRIETYFNPRQNFFYQNAHPSTIDLTNVVKHWYADQENNGIILKAFNEGDSNYRYADFLTNDNKIESDPRPILYITYRNQNGLESYMTYHQQSFSNATVYTNDYNGNLIALFQSLGTNGQKLPISINFVYNTNDVLLKKDYGYGLGYRLNLFQTLSLNERNELEYTDEDGTKHYFYYDEDKGTYHDEDNINLMIKKEAEEYHLYDLEKNKMIFKKINDLWCLHEIIDIKNDSIKLEYSNYKIIKVTDGNQDTIILEYLNNQLRIKTELDEINYYYENNQITSINDRNQITKITYHNNLISKIKDSNGLAVEYSYYDQIPYRVKSIVEYSREFNKGHELHISYGFDTTTFTNHLGKTNTLTFNEIGNTISTSSLKAKEELSEALGKAQELGTEGSIKNRLMLDHNLIGSIQNYLTNTSFEKEINPWTNGLITNGGRTGSHSLKVENETAYQIVGVPKNQEYNFSCYIKRISSTGNLKLALSYEMENETKTSYSKTIHQTAEYDRYDVSIFYDSSATSNLKLEIIADGTFLIDDVQLERGSVPNHYNLIENYDFKTMDSWITTTGDNHGEDAINDDEIITLSNGKTAYHLKSYYNRQKTLEQKIGVSGKKGDTYLLSFWYKNEGMKQISDITVNASILSFDYIIEEGEGFGYQVQNELNPNNSEWQFFSKLFTAKKDYTDLTLIFLSSYNVNSLYLTNFSLHKDVSNTLYDYNEYGEVINVIDQTNEKSDFKYNSNHQIQNITTKGFDFSYEYDNNIKDRVLKGISKNGIHNQLIYNEDGNLSKTKIYYQNHLLGNKEYRIRLKGTNDYLEANLNYSLQTTKQNCDNDKWTFKKAGDYYYICHLFTNRYLNIKEEKIILSKYPKKWSIEENENKSISIKDNNLYLTLDNHFILKEKLEDLYPQEYFLEDQQSQSITNSYEYTDNQKFLKSQIDTLHNKITYETTPRGLVTKIIDPKENIIINTYNDLDQIIKVEKNDQKVEYQYNNQNQIEEILHGTKVYQFAYDEFSKTKEIKINNQILINNQYAEKNGHLTQATYGNYHHIKYTYDSFNRPKSIKKMNDQYNITYNNLGKLTKITSNDMIEQFEYDFSDRIKNYQNNQFEIDYDYTKNNQINTITHTLNDLNHQYTYEYNEENDLTKVKLDDQDILTYNYDNLGRLKNDKLLNKFTTSYQYVTKGNNTSTLIETINNKYLNQKYEYDALGNIISIKEKDQIIKEYFYDEHNQLVKEHNKKNNTTIKYNYDNLGNIQKVITTPYKMQNIIKADTYEYLNKNWEDQLTKFNNELISYDQIGNLIRIGNKKLSWINGRELKSYQDENQIIEYKYNKDGIRTKKTINGKTTEYYLQGNKIIVEKTEDNMLYYLYNSSSSIIGFIYNGNNYYYLKNLQNDIIGILDNNLELVVTYEYDEWGSILEITDANGNQITDENHIANINPFRYRSYYYDQETKLYYLNSRYYNPEWKRFINVDIGIANIGELKGYNMYEYTFNNPISFQDEEGNWPNLLKKVAVGVAVIAVCAIVVIATGGAGAGVAGYIAANALKGALIGASVGTVVGATKSVIQNKKTTGSYEGSVNAAINGAADGFAGGAITGAITGTIKGILDISIASSKWDKGTFNSEYESMNYHYNKHVIDEGITGTNIVNYTNNAIDFSNNNRSILNFTNNYNYGNQSWNFTYSFGQGGQFTRDGRIITFWYK